MLTREQAINYSTAGPVLRASGVAYDIRRAAPYSIYDRFDFKVDHRQERRPLRPVLRAAAGDARERRILETGGARHSRTARSCLARRATRSRCPRARPIRGSRTPRASSAITWCADGSPTAYRYHVRSPSFINLTALEAMCLGHTIADVVGHSGKPRHRAGRGRSVSRCVLGREDAGDRDRATREFVQERVVGGYTREKGRTR